MTALSRRRLALQALPSPLVGEGQRWGVVESFRWLANARLALGAGWANRRDPRPLPPPHKGEGEIELAEQTSAPLDPDLPSLIGAAGWARLAPAIRRRFALGHGVHPVAYEGRMRVERSPAGIVFALLAKLFGGPLPIRACPDAQACVEVRSDGRGGVVWKRTLIFAPGASAMVVRSTKRRDGRGQLLECVDGGLGMRLSVFEEQGALVFESLSYFLHIGALKLPIPAIAAPGVCRVTHADQGGDRFRFTLAFTHPLWGRTFVQDGVFLDPEHELFVRSRDRTGEPVPTSPDHAPEET